MTEKKHNVQPIQTEYDGYKFRSRLEARWAVFFNYLDIDYRYEPEGFKLSNDEWYLPDFYLKNVAVRSTEREGMWAEVKSEKPECSWRKGVYNTLNKLTTHTSECAALLVGEVSNHAADRRGEEYHFESNPELGIDNYMYWMKCYNCGEMKFEFHETNYMSCEICGANCDHEHNEIEKAVKKARSARFEHGEKPA
jgi:hypothetical protein